MNKLKNIAAMLALTGVFAGMSFADVTPPPGFTRVHVGIILETEVELTGYRFFLVSSNLVKEVKVKKGEKTTVDALGGGARYRGGRIVAIPSHRLESYGIAPQGEKLETMNEDISNDRIAGVVKLITHTFAREVREADASGVPDEAYRIEKEGEGLIAVPIAAPNGKVSFGITDIERGPSLITVGALMSLAFITLGLIVFRRSQKRVS